MATVKPTPIGFNNLDLPFLDEDDKRKLVKEKATFTIHAIRRVNTAYGPKIFLEVDSEGNFPLSILSIPDADWRTPFVEYVSQHLPLKVWMEKTERGSYVFFEVK